MSHALRVGGRPTRIATAVITAVLLTPLGASADGVAGLEWEAPEGWAADSTRSMRAVTYVVPGAGGADDGECAVFYFGQGQGGSVDANVSRWLGQFRPAQGQTALDPSIESADVNGIPTTRVDVWGTFLFKAFPAAPRATEKPGYRMLAAIVEGPAGAVFFKLTAPETTANAGQAAFEAMIASLRSSGP